MKGKPGERGRNRKRDDQRKGQVETEYGSEGKIDAGGQGAKRRGKAAVCKGEVELWEVL